MKKDKKDSKPKDDKKINEDFEGKILRLYDPKLKANLAKKELPPIETPGKKNVRTLIIKMSNPFGFSENDRYDSEDISRNDNTDSNVAANKKPKD